MYDVWIDINDEEGEELFYVDLGCGYMNLNILSVHQLAQEKA